MEFFSLTSIKNCLEILVMDRTVLESEAKLLKHYYLTFEKKKTFCRKRKKAVIKRFLFTICQESTENFFKLLFLL